MKFIKNDLLLFVVLTICFNCTNEENKNTSPLISKVDTISPQIISAPPLQLLDEEQQQDDVDQSKNKKNQPSAQTSDKKASTDYSSNSLLLDEISKILSAQTETYQINPTKDTLITCPKGTVVFLPANSLELPNGESAKNSVELKIKECYEVSEFIGDHLTTLTTKGDLLESGGMVNISAWSAGDELKMKKGSEFALYFPKRTAAKDMQLFYGNQGTNGMVDWGLNQEITSFVNSITIISDISFFNSPNWQSVSEFICKPLLTMDEDGEQYVFRNIWKLKRSNETFINYFDQNFPLSKDLADQMIENKKKAEVTIYIDDLGNLKDIFYKKTGIQELDSLVLNFFNTLPQLEISSILQHRLSKGYKIQIGGVWLCETDYDPKFNQKFDEKYAAFKDQAITQIDQSELNYYVLTASSFGWINCDRFYQSPAKKVDYVVNVKDKLGDMKIVIAFKDMNSIMQGYQQGGQTKFAKIPINQPIKIIGISYENEKPMLAIAETITSEQGFELADFKEFTLDELKSQLGN